MVQKDEETDFDEEVEGNDFSEEQTAGDCVEQKECGKAYPVCKPEPVLTHLFLFQTLDTLEKWVNDSDHIWGDILQCTDQSQ